MKNTLGIYMVHNDKVLLKKVCKTMFSAIFGTDFCERLPQCEILECNQS